MVLGDFECRGVLHILIMVGWLVGCFGFNDPLDSISVYIGPSPREREKVKN